jgi:hypothetical protein
MGIMSGPVPRGGTAAAQVNFRVNFNGVIESADGRALSSLSVHTVKAGPLFVVSFQFSISTWQSRTAD